MSSITSRLPGAAVRFESAAVPFELATPVQMLIAALSGAAGVIHLVMFPSHLDEWALEGAGFALAGWLQIAVAVLILLRPSRLLLSGSIVAGIALVALWTLSRTAGFPFGPHAWHAETAGFVDVTAVAIQTALIGVCALLLARPSFGNAWNGSDRFVTYAFAIGVLVLATAALASPSARDHAAGSHGAHAHGGDDKGLSLLTNGHHQEIVQYEIDPVTEEILTEQLDETREVARMYPTVADAEAAGYRRAGPYSPGLGAHYIKYGPAEANADGIVDGDDALHPLAIIYDGTEPGSPIAGFMYYSMAAEEPQGFVGPNDTWHYHENVCIKMAPTGEIDAPLGADREVNEAQCAAVGGSLLTTTQWMVHVWSVPGYDNVDGGVFAEVNPALACPDGTYYQRPVDEWVDNLMTTCRATTAQAGP